MSSWEDFFLTVEILGSEMLQQLLDLTFACSLLKIIVLLKLMMRSLDMKSEMDLNLHFCQFKF